MRVPVLALCFVALSLAWLVFLGAGIQQADWEAALIFLGATAIFYWSYRTGQTPPRLPWWQSLALWALPLYVVFQNIPLPPAMLETFSPARALIATSLAGVIPNLRFAPISIVPALGIYGCFSLLGCLTAFSLMRDIGWRCAASNPWVPVAPLAFIALLEAGVGIGQWVVGPPNTPLLGTFTSREHFAGLLEIALPFTIAFGFVSFRRHQRQLTSSSAPAVRATTAWSVSLLLLSAIVHASSQTSYLVVAASLFILLAFGLIPELKTKKPRWIGIGIAVSLPIAAILWLTPPGDFTASVAQLASSDKAAADARLRLWTSAASLLDDFRWCGTGLGGFQSAFLKYQDSTDLSRVLNPHSDLLAMPITLGLVGSCIVVVALAGILRPSIMGALYLRDESRRLLAAALVASLTAVLFRGALESTLSVPAIALTFAWIAGLSQASGLD